MAQFIFGAGNMYVTQLQDALGAAVANPSPQPLMALQGGEFDFSGDVKELHGQNQFPVAVARGKGKITIKVKPSRVFASLWNAIMFGQTLSPGIIAVQTDSVGQAIPATPFQITVAPPSAGTFMADMGVIDANGKPMQRVASAPATGQYSVAVATGQYTFAAADAGKLVYINYKWQNSAATSGQKQTVANLPMGYVPTFGADFTVAYMGKITTFSFPLCVASKLGVGAKNDDFAVPDMQFSAFDNGTGNVMSWALSE